MNTILSNVSLWPCATQIWPQMAMTDDFWATETHATAESQLSPSRQACVGSLSKEKSVRPLLEVGACSALRLLSLH